jgi:hypothetical protein
VKNSNKDFVFASPLDNQPPNRKAIATALRGTKVKGKVKTPGLRGCTLRWLRLRFESLQPAR